MSPFEELLLTYKFAPWDWSLVSANPSVSFQFMMEHPELPWVPKYISRNPSITESNIRCNMEYPWDYEELCMNPNLSLTFFNDYIIKPGVVHRVDWQSISSNPSITMLDIINNPSYKWNDRYLSSNPNLTSNFILNEGKSRNWFIPSVSANSGITDTDIFKSTLRTACGGTFEWDYRNLSSNPNLPIAYVVKNMDYEWNYFPISMRASLNDIKTYHQIPWNAQGLSMNPNISFDYINDHKHIKWHRHSLLMNLSLESIIDNMIWFDCINTPTEYLSSNPTITIKWVKKNYQSINWKRLSCNALTKK